VIGTSDDEAATQLDLYLDRVLAGDADPGMDGSPVADVADLEDVPAVADLAVLALGSRLSSIEPDLARVSALVAGGATRFHPSFRFEERLAARLRDSVVGLERGEAPRGVMVPFAPGPGPDRVRSRHLGGVLVGGAIASGVSIASLAGAAAVVVWRRAHWERLV